MANLSFLGAPVKVRTFCNEIFSGEVFCYDQETNLVVLKEPHMNGRVDLRVIRASTIQEILYIAPPNQPVDPYLPGLEPRVLEHREKRALDHFEKNKHSKGIRVTREAQEIFDFISKTHPECKWQGNNMVVLGVQVVPPYASDNCSGGDDKVLKRIQEVLDKFKSRRAREHPPSAPHSVPPPSANPISGNDGPLGRPQRVSAGASPHNPGPPVGWQHHPQQTPQRSHPQDAM